LKPNGPNTVTINRNYLQVQAANINNHNNNNNSLNNQNNYGTLSSNKSSSDGLSNDLLNTSKRPRSVSNSLRNIFSRKKRDKSEEVSSKLISYEDQYSGKLKILIIINCIEFYLYFSIQIEMNLKNSKTLSGSLKRMFTVGKKPDQKLTAINNPPKNSGIVKKQVPISPTINISR
jgi:hypothetical protein